MYSFNKIVGNNKNCKSTTVKNNEMAHLKKAGIIS